jgi:hypothetical protein
MGIGPLAQVAGDGGDGVAGAFAYVPLSLPFADDRLIVHGNIGWVYERGLREAGSTHRETQHAAAWATRADLLLPVATRRITLIGELYGEGRSRAEYQLGLRSEWIRGRFLTDVSWGGSTARGTRSAGWALGFAWTPPPFL